MSPQERINHMQSLYKDWLNTQTQLETALAELKRSHQLIKELEQFYFEGEWQDIFQQIEQGLDINLTTDGEYSVMGEDTLWNASHQQQALMWDFLRTATKALDKEKPEFYNDDE